MVALTPDNFAKLSCLEKSRYYASHGNQRGRVIMARKALEENPHCEEAWDLLYPNTNSASAFKEFREDMFRRYVPERASTAADDSMRAPVAGLPALTLDETLGDTAPNKPARPDLEDTQPGFVLAPAEEIEARAELQALLVEAEPALEVTPILGQEMETDLVLVEAIPEIQDETEAEPIGFVPVPEFKYQDEIAALVSMVPAQNDMQPQPARPAKAERTGTAGDVLSALVFMPYAGTYVVPFIVVGEILLYFLMLGGRNTSGIGGYLVGIVISVIVLFIAAYAVPPIGYLFYFFLMVMIFLSMLVGGVFGLILGLACTLGYVITRWSTSTVSGVVCALTGGAAGVGLGFVSNFYLLSAFVKDSPLWAGFNFLIFIACGVTAGILFVGIADGTGAGGSLNEQVMQESTSGSMLKSPLRFYVKTANLFKSYADEGKRFS